MIDSSLYARTHGHLEQWKIRWFPTGSYYLGYHDKTYSDMDFVLLLEDEKKHMDWVENYSYHIAELRIGGSIDPNDPLDHETVSYKDVDNRVNFIVCSNKEVYSKWLRATKLAKAFELESKPHRVAMFQRCKAGAPSEEFEPVAVPF